MGYLRQKASHNVFAHYAKTPFLPVGFYESAVAAGRRVHSLGGKTSPRFAHRRRIPQPSDSAVSAGRPPLLTRREVDDSGRF